jgi:hypothetical protein
VEGELGEVAEGLGVVGPVEVECPFFQVFQSEEFPGDGGMCVLRNVSPAFRRSGDIGRA